MIVGQPYPGMPAPSSIRLVEGAVVGGPIDAGRVIEDFGPVPMHGLPMATARLAADEKRGVPFAIDYFCPTKLLWLRHAHLLYGPEDVVSEDGFVARPYVKTQADAAAVLAAEREAFEREKKKADAKARNRHKANERADAKRARTMKADTSFEDTVGR